MSILSKKPFAGKLLRTLGLFALPLLATAAPVHPQVRNVVLVHGAFVDGSSWSEVIVLLRRKGYHVTAVQNPLTSLADDVAATRRVLDRQDGDVILVGHSWAGAVVTEAGNADKVKGIVYLSALVPDTGESVSDLLARLHAPMEGMAPDAEGRVWLNDPVAYAHVLAGDVPEAKVAVMAAVAPPMAVEAFSGKVSRAAWRDKPTWYLMTERDNALPLDVQQRIAKAIDAHRVVLSSSHLSPLSHPADVARLIDEAAQAVNRNAGQ
jgi:pimeloyl-ACP methyl ester carboxylesterase